MKKEVIFEPEIDLIKNNEYYLFYEMLMQSLRTENVKEGINKSLELLRLFLQSDNILLFKKNDNNRYVFEISDTPTPEHIKFIYSIINTSSPLIETKGIFNLDFNLAESLKNIMTIHFQSSDNKYILVINNYDKSKKLESLFWEKLRETMRIILKRAIIYDRNIRAISMDLLTGLDNRNAFEMRMQGLDENDDKLVFGIFDLFRLKFLNDNYGHAIGDAYIKKTAKILNRYWPKRISSIQEDGIEKFTETGHTLYRVGGDEYILLTNVEDINSTNVKANLAKEEVRLLDLEIDDQIPLGLNYGIIMHKPGDFIKNTYLVADEIMKEDKHKMYVKYGLERRR